MKAAFIWIFCLAALPVLAQSNDERVVLRLSAAKFRWMTQGKADSLKSILDEKLQFIHSNGWIQSKAEVISDMESGKLQYKMVDVTSVEARAIGQDVIITGTGKFEGTNAGSPFSIVLRFSEVYQKRGERWYLILRQASRLP